MSTEGPVHERRRATRMAAKFRVRIAGVDREMVERRGDISRTGIYLDCDADVGRPGSVQTLLIALPDSDEIVHALARVIRVATLDDLYAGHRVLGVAFEFLLADSDEPVTGSYDKERASRTLRRLVRAVAARHLVRDVLALDRPLDATVAGTSDEGAASVRDLGLEGLTLDTTWPIPEGETVRIDVPTPGSGHRVRLLGRATRTTKSAAGAHYRVRVEVMGVEEEGEGPSATEQPSPAAPPGGSLWSAAGSSMADVVGSLLDQALEPHIPARAEKAQHLFGDLARIPVPSLLTLLEINALEGVLQVRHPEGPMMVYVKGGRIIDAEGRGRSARGALATLLPMRDGEFEFNVEQVDRPDQFGMSLTALVLDVVKGLDESNRPE